MVVLETAGTWGILRSAAVILPTASRVNAIRSKFAELDGQVTRLSASYV